MLPAESSFENSNGSFTSDGPIIVGPELWKPTEVTGYFLTPQERELLASIATVVRFRKGETIYREGDPAVALFNISVGVTKSQVRNSYSQHTIVGFHFVNDIFGLSQNGKYIHSVEAVDACVIYRIYAIAFARTARLHPKINLMMIRKLSFDLSNANSCMMVLKKRHAVAKLSWFLQDLRRVQLLSMDKSEEIYLPMSRVDIADYLGISAEAVSRAFRNLVERGTVHLRDRRHVKILNEADLEAAVYEP
jgi:CRP-like cAMP-binding protein